MKVAMKIMVCLILLGMVSLMGCANGFQLQNPMKKVAGGDGTIATTKKDAEAITTARDVIKAVVDFLCPASIIPDEGSFLSGVLEQFTLDQGDELKPSTKKDIALIRSVCDLPPEERSDFKYGRLTGGALSRVLSALIQGDYIGKDGMQVLSWIKALIK